VSNPSVHSVWAISVWAFEAEAAIAAIPAMPALSTPRRLAAIDKNDPFTTALQIKLFGRRKLGKGVSNLGPMDNGLG
jgi:hypothetical protein